MTTPSSTAISTGPSYTGPSYNASLEIYRENASARIFRIFPDGPRLRYAPGQYGSLGLLSKRHPDKLIKRAYSLSSSIVDLASRQLLDSDDLNYYEVYINRFESADRDIERLTPQLFELSSGARIFCGTKIVGHYTLGGVNPTKNVLLLGTTTGESPNNAISHQVLSEARPIRIANVAIGAAQFGSAQFGSIPWRSLYEPEHAFLMDTYPQYRYLPITTPTPADYRPFEQLLRTWLEKPQTAEQQLGFVLTPENAHVFLCGDPQLIGAPKKLGGWNYEYPDHGVFRLLTQFNFQLKTKFQDGNVEYETYW